MANENLSKNQAFVNTNLENLRNLYKNKYILVYEQEVVGSFDTYEVAAEEGINNYGLDGGFLVHYVTETTPVNFISTALL
ncbi:MAG: hypothetical protein NTX61_14785 [Bacteroidetes bacterium]|nr:hypothetical protein [Bacteroidota bacterium]